MSDPEPARATVLQPARPVATRPPPCRAASRAAPRRRRRAAAPPAARRRRPGSPDRWTRRHVEHPRTPRRRAPASSPRSSTSASRTSSRRSSSASSTCWRPWRSSLSWLIFVIVGFAEEHRHRPRRPRPRADLRHHLPRGHPHDPRVLPLGRAHERGHPQAPPPGLTPARREPRPCAPPRRLAPAAVADVGCALRRQRAGCCWVMQWMPPPRAKSGAGVDARRRGGRGRRRARMRERRRRPAGRRTCRR